MDMLFFTHMTYGNSTLRLSFASAPTIDSTSQACQDTQLSLPEMSFFFWELLGGGDATDSPFVYLGVSPVLQDPTSTEISRIVQATDEEFNFVNCMNRCMLDFDDSIRMEKSFV